MLDFETAELSSAPQQRKADTQSVVDANIFELAADLVKPDRGEAEAPKEAREHTEI